MNRSTRAYGAILTAAVLIAAGVTPAMADESTPDEIALQASNVAPYIGEIQQAAVDSGAAVAEGDSISLSASGTLGTGIEVAGPSDATPVVASVGFGSGAASPELASDGT